MWQLRYNKVDPATGNRKEQTTIVGRLTDFPTESACWREIDRQRLIERINQPEIQTKLCLVLSCSTGRKVYGAQNAFITLTRNLHIIDVHDVEGFGRDQRQKRPKRHTDY